MGARTAVSSLADILARCKEVGDCMEWQGALSSGRTPMTSLAQAWPKRPGAQAVRVAAYVLAWEASTGQSVGNRVVYRTCCNHLCCEPEHLRAGTWKQMQAFMSAAGVYKRPPDVMARVTKTHRAKAPKLTMDKAREIRASQENSVKLAARYGVHHSLISRIKLGKAWRETVAGASVFHGGHS